MDKPIQAVTPSDVLGDHEDYKISSNGTAMRKGSIAATFANARIFESLAADCPQEQLDQLRAGQMALIVTLDQVGLFSFFGADHMLDFDPTKEGRIWIALLYFWSHPEKLSPEIKQKIASLKKEATPLLSREIKTLFDNLSP